LTARNNYVNAVASVTKVANALVMSSNRFGGARQANQPSAGFLQRATGKIYSGVMATRLQTQAMAGRALARLLVADHLDAFAGAKKVKSLDSGLLATVATPAVLDTLVGYGLAPDRRHARTLLGSTLAGVSGSLDLAAALKASTSTRSFTTRYNSMSMSELASIVIGLHDQGDLSTSTAQTLVDDLANAQSSCTNASRRTAAINQFIADTTRLTSGTTATFLKLGAQPLTATNLPSASCL
jgi:tetrahydromethanopterin S-methyltransferase subunit F